MAGLPVLYLPPRYMSEDASQEEKEIYAYYQRVIRNLQFNEQAGLILPQAFDPESRQKLFEFTLMGTQGGKSYDSSGIITRYNNEILTTFFADILTMGQDKVGSYSLASNKSSILSTAIEAKLGEVADVINQDLIPQTFALNGWDDIEFPKVVFSDVDEQSLDEMSKFVQRVFSVGAMELDRDVANAIRKVGKFPVKPDDEPIDWDTIPSYKSRSGDGMNKSGNGTSDNAAGRDNSVSNSSASSEEFKTTEINGLPIDMMVEDYEELEDK
jgi:hypothetical protein